MEQLEDRFEEHLSEQLRRVDVPDGFADRILSRVEAAPALPANVIVMPSRRRVWMSGAVAAAVLAGAVLTQQVQERRQRHQVAVAEQQFDAAIRITGETLDDTRQQLREAGLEIGK